LLRLRNKGGTALRFEDTANSLTAELRTNGSGLEVSGDFAVLSSREAKRITGSVEPQRILSQMLRLPLEFWHYKDDPSRRVHLGPMAEDWSEAFTFGGASETLSLVDATGVTIAAIQGLHAELRDRDRSIAALEAANAELRSQLAELSGLVARLVEQHEVGLARSP